ncbi:ABC transporter permease subunit [Stenoxybacter acetivorans]|uniref:ABC transporter permease subunit n=1 Tax=Stenoxybacter acetivorans TaxID=422441 RepID=UPI000569AEB7|nr:ABC transporter permease subunit [Stenoxybacter acetivorans]
MRLNPKAGKWLFVVLALWFLMFLCLPMLQLLTESWQENGQFSGSHYRQIIGDEKFRQAWFNSLNIAALSALSATVLAFLPAYAIHRTALPKPFKQGLRFGMLFPMLLPTITYGFAIIYTFGKQGLLTQILHTQIFSDLYGFKGLWLGYTLYTLPTAFLLLSNTFHYLDKKCVLVSLLMGDSAWRRFGTTVLQPLVGTLAAAFIQCFFLSFTDFGIPASIGGKYEVVAIRLYTEMLGSSPSFGRGAVAALSMLLPAVVSVAMLSWLSRFNAAMPHTQTTVLPRCVWADYAWGAVSAMLVLAILSPFAVILIVPWVQSWPYVLSFSTFTVWDVLTTPNLTAVYRNTLWAALFTALAGTVLSFSAALLRERMALPRAGKIGIEAAALASNTIPGMVLGIAYLMLFSGSLIANTLMIIVVCNIAHYFATPYLMSKNALEKMNQGWEATAALMGDSWLKTLRRVILPNALPTLLEMFAYYFVNAMVTVSAVIFLAGAHSMVLTGKIKELQHFGKFDEIFVLSAMIMLTNLLVLALLGGWRYWRQRRQIPTSI